MAGKLVVLGGGESGVGAAVLGLKKGYEVFLSDRGEIKQNYIDVLLKYKIEFEQGKHSVERILQADVVVKSPGIPDDSSLVVQLKTAKTPVISEIEFAYKYCKAKIIGITGSNGKTTTTSMIYHLLKQSGLNVGLAGNIGKSFAWQVSEEAFDTYVLELSSFQLDGIDQFSSDIAVLLNITPDHLDRYNYELQNYVDSKFRIVKNAHDKTVFIHSADDELVNVSFNSDLFAACKAKALSFSVEKNANAVFEDGILKSGKGFEIPMSELNIKGKHNAANALSAILVAQEMGVLNEQIIEGLKTFEAIEHRLEKVRDKDGVEFINDSKATNVDASYYALDAMTKPVVWIVGGVDKGNDYQVLMPLIEEKVKAIVCLGTNNKKLIAAFGNKVAKLEEAISASEAVEKAMKLAVNGDVVLLSPACASFDLFKNYEDRGKQFKQAINNL